MVSSSIVPFSYKILQEKNLDLLEFNRFGHEFGDRLSVRSDTNLPKDGSPLG